MGDTLVFEKLRQREHFCITQMHFCNSLTRFDPVGAAPCSEWEKQKRQLVRLAFNQCVVEQASNQASSVFGLEPA